MRGLRKHEAKRRVNPCSHKKQILVFKCWGIPSFRGSHNLDIVYAPALRKELDKPTWVRPGTRLVVIETNENSSLEKGDVIVARKVPVQDQVISFGRRGPLGLFGFSAHLRFRRAHQKNLIRLSDLKGLVVKVTG